MAGQHDRVGARCVGAADDRAGVAGIAYVGADRDQPGAGHGPGEGHVDVPAQGHDAGRVDRVGEQGERTLLDPGDADVVRQAGEEVVGVGEGEDLLDAAGRERGRDGLGAVGEEQPPLGAFRAAAEPTYFLQASVARLQRRGQAEASALGALTSSGSAALAVATIALNAATSLTASSARILRSTSMPARLRPWMNRL